MFDLAQTAEQAAIADSVRQLSERRIRPLMKDGGRPTPKGLADVRGDLHAMGLTAPVSAEYGGQGVPDAGTSLLIAEEVAFGDPGVAYDLVMTCHAAMLIEALGTDALRASFLPRFASDPAFRAGVAYFEGFGRSPVELETVARRAADGWQLDGAKVGVTRPTDADLLLTVATDAEHGRLVVFAVEPSSINGFEVTRDDAVVGKLGLDGAATGNVTLRAVAVPDAARLPGDGLAVHRSVAGLRLGVGAVLLGTARAELAYAVDYANTREAFGQRISSYQGVAFPLVDIATELDAARLQLWRAAELVASADDPAEVVTITAEAVARCQQLVLESGRIGINTLGGHGFIQDHPLEQWYRGAATLAALDFDPLESDSSVL